MQSTNITMSTYKAAPKSGRRWDDKERARLLDLTCQDVPVEIIAELMGRSVNAIRDEARRSFGPVPTTCRASDCHREVSRRPGPGRPRIYCSDECAPKAARQTQPPSIHRMGAVELSGHMKRTGLSFRQIAAEIGIGAGPGILHAVISGATELYEWHSEAIRALPDATLATAGKVAIEVPEELAPAVTAFLRTLGVEA